MTDKIRHISYTAADIEKYWRGGLSPAEMHAMERAALEDPLLSEAMEGFALAVKRGGFQPAADMESIQRRLDARVGAAKRRPFAIPGWWRIAAVFFIVLLGSGVAYLLVRMPVQQPITKQEAAGTGEKDRIAPFATDSIRPGQKAGSGTAGNPVDIAAADEKKIPTAPRQQEQRGQAPKPGSDRHRKMPVGIASLENGLAEKRGKESNFAAPVRPGALAVPPAAAAGKERTDSEIAVAEVKASQPVVQENKNLIISGTVVDPLLRPIANATISVKGSPALASTDDKGNFFLRVPDSATQLSIGSAGYRSYEFNLTDAYNRAGNRFTLQPADPSMNEVVVTGYGIGKKRAGGAKILQVKPLDAAPVIGWDAYNEYLEKNRLVPPALQSIHGDVVVTFNVTARGRPKGFRVVQSLGDTLDREAIRLVRDGPDWQLLRGKKAAATIIIKF